MISRLLRSPPISRYPCALPTLARLPDTPLPPFFSPPEERGGRGGREKTTDHVCLGSKLPMAVSRSGRNTYRILGESRPARLLEPWVYALRPPELVAEFPRSWRAGWSSTTVPTPPKTGPRPLLPHLSLSVFPLLHTVPPVPRQSGEKTQCPPAPPAPGCAAARRRGG